MFTITAVYTSFNSGWTEFFSEHEDDTSALAEGLYILVLAKQQSVQSMREMAAMERFRGLGAIHTPCFVIESSRRGLRDMAIIEDVPFDSLERILKAFCAFTPTAQSASQLKRKVERIMPDRNPEIPDIGRAVVSLTFGIITVMAVVLTLVGTMPWFQALIGVFFGFLLCFLMVVALLGLTGDLRGTDLPSLLRLTVQTAFGGLVQFLSPRGRDEDRGGTPSPPPPPPSPS